MAEMTCNFFLSDDGCKKGRLCEAKHVPKEKGCKKCGSIKHRSHQCDRGKPMDPKTPRTPKKDGGKPRANTSASAAAKGPAKKEQKKKDGKDGKTPRNKEGKGKSLNNDQRLVKQLYLKVKKILKTPTLNLNKLLKTL
eukprot:3632634-Amphidinium_carterae.2